MLCSFETFNILDSTGFDVIFNCCQAYTTLYFSFRIQGGSFILEPTIDTKYDIIWYKYVFTFFFLLSCLPRSTKCCPQKLSIHLSWVCTIWRNTVHLIRLFCLWILLVCSVESVDTEIMETCYNYRNTSSDRVTRRFAFSQLFDNHDMLKIMEE